MLHKRDLDEHHPARGRPVASLFHVVARQGGDGNEDGTGTNMEEKQTVPKTVPAKVVGIYLFGRICELIFKVMEYLK